MCLAPHEVLERRMAESAVEALRMSIGEHGRSLYNMAMTTKEIALKTIEQLPEGVSWEEIQERINFIVGVRKGLRELDEGKGIPHDKIKEEFSEWLTN